MSQTIEVTAPDGNVLEIDAPDGASPDQIHQAAIAAASHYKGQSPSQQPPKQIIQPDANPMALVAKGAPSNLMKLAGIAGANAPNAANIVLNAIPGFGDPNQITPNAVALAKQPKQILNAIKRVNAVQQGSELKPVEKVPALIGKVGGTALEMAAAPTINPSIKAIGPFTAGVADPSTALPGAFEKAGEALGQAKTAGGAGVESPIVGELLTRLENSKEAKGLLTEARNWVSTGMKKDVPNAVLLAYKQVLGQAQAEGGTFADVYAQAGKKVSEKLAEQAPDIADKMERMATQYAAKGTGKPGFPWLGLYLNREMAAIKMATMPAVRNAAGAATGLAMRAMPAISSVGNAVKGELQNPVITPAALTLTADKAKEFLKLAKGNKDKARKMAQDKGYVIPQIQ